MLKRSSKELSETRPKELRLKKEEINYLDFKSSNVSISVKSKDSNRFMNQINKSAFLNNYPQISMNSAKSTITQGSDIYMNQKLKEKEVNIDVNKDNYNDILAKKVEKYKTRYLKVLKVVKDHEEKFDKLISIINSVNRFSN